MTNDKIRPHQPSETFDRSEKAFFFYSKLIIFFGSVDNFNYCYSNKFESMVRLGAITYAVQSMPQLLELLEKVWWS